MKRMLGMTLSTVIMMASLSFFPTKGFASSNEVVPISLTSDAPGYPMDENSTRIKKILLNTNKYALTTWWDEKKNFDAQGEGYLDLGGKEESDIRHPAAMSLGLAASLSFHVYDPSYIGVSSSIATQRTSQLVSSLALHHRVNTSQGWGNRWQSAHWAYFAGFAGWLIWEDLSEENQEYVRRMVEYEANRFIEYDVPYWKSPEGEVLFPGDTKAEENAWNAQLLQLATAMMPEHQNWNLWMNKNIELMVSSAATPTDQNNTYVVNGKPVKDWINGSNINEDGTVVNHGFIHPDYMEFIAFNNTSGIHYTLAGMSTPEAAFYHSDLVYNAYIDLPFASPPFEGPGGTIYKNDSSDIYYPQGNDWGTDRRMQFATLDIFADVFGYDSSLSKGGSYWEPLHAQKVLDMQNRHSDGHTYATFMEDTYDGREEWVAHHAAWALMAKWIKDNPALRISNKSYGPTYKRLSGKDRYETSVEISKEGWTASETVIIASGENFPDALASVPLAGKYDAPVLLTRSNQLPGSIEKEIVRLGAKRIIIVGGTSAIAGEVEETIRNLGAMTSRIDGKDRFETSVKIAEQLPSSDKAFLVNAYDFPDALSVASIASQQGIPILLTKQDKVPFSTQSYIEHTPFITLIGGESVISGNVEKSIGEVDRIAGRDRYETAVKVMETLQPGAKTMMVSNGESFPDALSGSGLAATLKAPLVLTRYNEVPAVTKEVFEEDSIEHFYLLGGENILGEKIPMTLLDQ
ncbi:cell wall-binding repeat-containing protein [Rossellomorea arthrocnemi]